MAIQLQNKRSAEFSSASMSDLVFLLLIFFMITSTLVAPNAINIMLPKSSSGKQLASRNIEVYIDANKLFYLNPEGQNSAPITIEELLPALQNAVAADKSDARTIILRADATVPVQTVVSLWDVLNTLNEGIEETQRYKLIFATVAKE
ncbi:MAG: biopolymer transporter ExbD [Bacteroidetes bacterium HGW-Bacteroidetes-20]|nr:MAG: biopolymer transporter ExbD [Bacteroidetes bacterium HGW-Bacteroidetes-20]